MDGDRREALRRRYRELVDEALPAAAARESWPIRRERMLTEGEQLVGELDGRSLAWRGRPAKRHPGPSALDPAAGGGPR